MNVLGIETSCDETAIAIVEGQGERLQVKKSIVFSQIEKHRPFGGVVPEVAARMHLEKIFPMFERELKNDGSDFDVVAVTAGPGLTPALRTGVEVAKALTWITEKPLVPVAHLEGHIYANWLEGYGPEMPLLALLVSGGHTELVLMHGHGKFERIGETLDDAAGEAFDKVAKMLGLPYPGGPEIAVLAESGDKEVFDFPRGLLTRPGYDFSFSGLKTSVLYTLRKEEDQINDPIYRSNIAASFQEAVVDVLTRKTARAVKEYKPKAVVIAGGVSANIELRHRIQQVIQGELSIPVSLPPFAYSLDNAAMIAAAGYFRSLAGDYADPLTLKSNPNLDFVCKS